MPDKLMRLRRSDAAADIRRPVMLAIAGDSMARKLRSWLRVIGASPSGILRKT